MRLPTVIFNLESKLTKLRNTNMDQKRLKIERPVLPALGDRKNADRQSCEHAKTFNEGVTLVREKIKAHLAENTSILVALSGKTGSGKTTLASALRKVLAGDKINTTVVSTDNFYLPKSNELDLEKLHAAINRLQKDESVGNLAPAEVIFVEGLQTIEDEAMGQKPDIRAYITVPANKRFTARLLRDGMEFINKLTETEFTPEAIATILKFETDPLMGGVDVVINNDRKTPSEPELYLSGDSLIFSVPDGIKGAVKVAPGRIQFLEQIGIQRK